MSPRARVLVVVVLASLAAVGATLGLTAVTQDRTGPSAVPRRTACRPPLQLDLGVRTDTEALVLRRAAGLYRSGDTREAGRLFRRYDSPDARVGAALVSWPRRTVESLQELAQARPQNGTVRLHLGLALACSGRTAGARAEWRAAERVAPDSSAAISAGDLLHPPPEFAPGVPIFVPSVPLPQAIRRLPPGRQLPALARRARRPDPHAKLLYGWALQRLGHQISAERLYSQAATLAPNDPEPHVAAAVARFSKDRPADAFGRLGPLTQRFPRAATVRYHLGLLLLWTRRVDEGKRQLRLATRLQPGSVTGREAARFLARLGAG